MSRIFIIYH